MIGVPVLAGSAAYALSEAMGWKWGLERKATDARGFYGVIAVSVLAGLVIQYSPISPMKALFWSAVINGVVAVPLMVVIILLAQKSVMGAFTASRSTYHSRLDRDGCYDRSGHKNVCAWLEGDQRAYEAFWCFNKRCPASFQTACFCHQASRARAQPGLAAQPHRWQ